MIEAHQEVEDSKTTHCQGIEGHLGDQKKERKWVPAQGSNDNNNSNSNNNKNWSCPTSPSQIPHQNRSEALNLESQPGDSDDLEENDPPRTQKTALKAIPKTPCTC